MTNRDEQKSFHCRTETARGALERYYDTLRKPESELFRDMVAEVRRLAEETGTLILAHNYMPPEIFHGVGDIVGDSLGLAMAARESKAARILVCGVHFMGETAKLLNDSAHVLVPEPNAGCSLADAVTPEDVERMREKHPGAPVVTYVNTSAAVKAASDICCTSSNAVEVVRSLEEDRVIVLPDRNLAYHVARNVPCEVIPYRGRCIVHMLFDRAVVDRCRRDNPEGEVIVHPESDPAAQEAADELGSTGLMMKRGKDPSRKALSILTEESMVENLRLMRPDMKVCGPPEVCRHMQDVSLGKVLRTLKGEEGEDVRISGEIADDARRAVRRMLDVA